MAVVAVILAKLPPDSVFAIQSEKAFDPELLPEPESWRHRVYGRNRLSLWRSPVAAEAAVAESAPETI